MFKIEGKNKVVLPMNEITRIPSGTAITAVSIISTADIRVDGTIKGPVMTGGKTVVGENGAIVGDLLCKNSDISGTVTGAVTVEEVLTLTSTCVVKGDIKCQKLCIENGAVFEGNCHILAPEEFQALQESFKKNLSEL